MFLLFVGHLTISEQLHWVIYNYTGHFTLWICLSLNRIIMCTHRPQRVSYINYRAHLHLLKYVIIILKE